MAPRLSAAAASRYTIRQNAEINVTPFVDVMMVLLIIFMVAAPMATRSIDLDFPPVKPPTNVVPEEPTLVSIQESGLFIGDKPTTSRALVADLYARIGKGKASVNSRVLVRADADVPYGELMGVMNTLKANGFKQIGLIPEDIH